MTLELARLSGSRVLGLDENGEALQELRARADQEGLGGLIETVHGSMLTMDFPPGSFGLIWSEGSIWVAGWERGLREWRNFLRPGGCMVIHEMAWIRPDPPWEIWDYWRRRNPDIRDVSQCLETIEAADYEVMAHFALPPDLWWEEYYGPLEKLIHRLREKYRDDPQALRRLAAEENEVELYKRHWGYYGSAFFILRDRRGPDGAAGD